MKDSFSEGSYREIRANQTLVGMNYEMQGV